MCFLEKPSSLNSLHNRLEIQNYFHDTYVDTSDSFVPLLMTIIKSVYAKLGDLVAFIAVSRMCNKSSGTGRANTMLVFVSSRDLRKTIDGPYHETGHISESQFTKCCSPCKMKAKYLILSHRDSMRVTLINT